MGWQDRDYAAQRGGARPVWTQGPTFGGRRFGGGRSIVTTLIIINVVVYVLGMLGDTFATYIYGYGAMQSRAVMHGQIWRLITAQYLHAGTGHLLLNMIGLHFLGRPLEQMWSPRKFLAIYTLCGLFGNVFYTVLGAREIIDPLTPAVGASGCIFGLLGVVAVLFPHATVYVYFLFPIKIRTAAMIFGGIALLTILERGQNYGGEACHLAGLVFGVWWAMKGERWWATTEWRLPRGRPRTARSRADGGFADKIAQRREDEETIDRILRKVYEGGVHSLSEQEKRALREATERQRLRDREAGRVDRL